MCFVVLFLDKSIDFKRYPYKSSLIYFQEGSLVRSISLNLNLQGLKTLLFGAGRVGTRKLSYLLQSGAAVTVVEPEPSDLILDLAARGQIELYTEFSPELLDGCPLVFVTCWDVLAKKIITSIRAKNLWVNVADRPQEGNFTLPAVVAEEPFKISVSTGGASPALSARVCAILRDTFAGYGPFALLLGALRPLILESKLTPAKRQEIFKNLANMEDAPRLLKAGKDEIVLRKVSEIIKPIKLPDLFSFRE
jgi:siroheme synthase-like protein